MPEEKAKQADLSALRINRLEDPESGSSGLIKKPALYAALGIVAVAIIVILFTFQADSDASTDFRLTRIETIYPAQSEALLTASGYVVAQRQAAIASKGTGRLQFLYVEEGDAVKFGEIIAQLEHDDVDAALAQQKANLQMANASLEQARADLAEAGLNFNRKKDLLSQGLIATAEFDISEARFKGTQAGFDLAKAQIDLAKASVTSAQVNVENTRIRAPFDGTVLTKNADIGEMVAPFAASSNSRGAVVNLADMNSLEVEADVSESNIEKISVGLLCEIVLDAYPGNRYQGYVHKIVPTANRAKATVLTKVRFKQLNSRVLPEMSAKVYFLAGDGSAEQNAAAFVGVSKKAVLERNGKKVVFVVRNQTIIETVVEVGLENAGRVEIKRGAQAGDQVILNPSANLKDGQTFPL